MTTTTKRVLAAALLALLAYGVAFGLPGASAAAVFGIGLVLFEGFLWNLALRAWKRRRHGG